MKYHAVMIDETGCEFGADVEAANRDEAYDRLDEDYPESRIVQLESSQDARDRENATYNHIANGGDWDDEGRPIYHYDYYDIDEEEEYYRRRQKGDEGW